MYLCQALWFEQMCELLLSVIVGERDDRRIGKWRTEVTVPSLSRRTRSATANGGTVTLSLRNAALGRQTDARITFLEGRVSNCRIITLLRNSASVWRIA
jgi:hypothetical protein